MNIIISIKGGAAIVRDINHEEGDGFYDIAGDDEEVMIMGPATADVDDSRLEHLETRLTHNRNRIDEYADGVRRWKLYGVWRNGGRKPQCVKRDSIRFVA